MKMTMILIMKLTMRLEMITVRSMRASMKKVMIILM